MSLNANSPLSGKVFGKEDLTKNFSLKNRDSWKIFRLREPWTLCLNMGKKIESESPTFLGGMMMNDYR